MSQVSLKRNVMIKFLLVYSPESVGMDVPTLLLVYKHVRFDFNGLFSIRRLFCLGLLIGFSIMAALTDIFEQINPDKLPIDIIEESDVYKVWYSVQIQSFESNVRKQIIFFLKKKIIEIRVFFKFSNWFISYNIVKGCSQNTLTRRGR